MKLLTPFYFYSMQLSQSLIDVLMAIIGLIAIFFIHKNKNFKHFFLKFKTLHLLLGLYFLICCFSLVFSPFNNIHFSELLGLKWIFEFILLTYFLTQIQLDNVHLKQILKVTSFISLLAIFIYFYGGIPFITTSAERSLNLLDTFNWRAKGLLNSAIAAAHSISLLFCILVAYFIFTIQIETNHLRRFLVFFQLLIINIFILFTYTRGVWISLGCTLLCSLFIIKSKKFNYFSLAFISLNFILFSLSDNLKNRVFKSFMNFYSGDQERLYLWKSYLLMFADYPLLGVGYENARLHLRTYYDRLSLPINQFESHAHNNYINLLANIGSFGFVCYIILFSYILRISYLYVKNEMDLEKKYLALGLLLAQICFHFNSLTEANFTISKNRSLFLLVCSLSLSLIYLKNLSAEKTESK